MSGKYDMHVLVQCGSRDPMREYRNYVRNVVAQRGRSNITFLLTVLAGVDAFRKVTISNHLLQEVNHLRYGE